MTETAKTSEPSALVSVEAVDSGPLWRFVGAIIATVLLVPLLHMPYTEALLWYAGVMMLPFGLWMCVSGYDFVQEVGDHIAKRASADRASPLSSDAASE